MRLLRAGRPPTGAVSEIIEIGLTVVDLRARRRVARHRPLVRPARSEVSPFRTGPTGLTRAAVRTGASFAEACRTLAREHDAGRRPWTSWGGYDRRQSVRQCRGAAVPGPFGTAPERARTHAKAVCTEVYGLRRKPGLARAPEIAGLPLEGRRHRGGEDARNIAALVLDLAGRGAWPGRPGTAGRLLDNSSSY
ncbi:3'-5' exonuclease [Streptomyces sp. NPDC023723]|uniref:3'-5' exonuclease n=1 Tax=Streptomyces sp. NPDC023723 TaxID=3154323 RepID=UPI0033CD9411